MRLPYVPEQPTMSNEEDTAILHRVLERRKGTLLPLDRALLHAPAVADGWNGFLGAIRTRTSLDADVRETAICRVAALNSAWFEWEHHAPLLIDEGGVSGEVVEKELKDTGKKGTEMNGLSERLRAVVEYTDAMTKSVVVPQSSFEKLRSLFGKKEVVEITATISAYNCVSRFLVALDIGEMAEKYGIDMS